MVNDGLVTEREDWIAKEMRSCVHFNGISNDTCAAGVNYRELVGGDAFGWALAIPCIRSQSDSKREMVPCLRKETPTREAAEQTVDEARARIDATLEAIQRGETPDNVIVCGARTEPEGKVCPSSVDGKCSKCGAAVEPIYGLGSGYGGIGGYSFCTNEDCGEVHNFAEDTGE